MKKCELETLVNKNIGIKKSKFKNYCLCHKDICIDNCNELSIRSFDNIEFINDGLLKYDKISIKSIIHSEREKTIFLEKFAMCQECYKYYKQDFCKKKSSNACLNHCYINDKKCKSCKSYILYNHIKNKLKQILNPSPWFNIDLENNDNFRDFILNFWIEIIFMNLLPPNEDPLTTKSFIKLIEYVVFEDFININDDSIFNTSKLYCKSLVLLNYLKDLIKDLGFLKKTRISYNCNSCGFFENFLYQYTKQNFQKCAIKEFCLHKKILNQSLSKNTQIERTLNFLENTYDLDKSCNLEKCLFDSSNLNSGRCNPVCFLNFLVTQLLSNFLDFGFIFYGNEEGIGSYWDPIRSKSFNPIFIFMRNPLRFLWDRLMYKKKLFYPGGRREPYFIKQYNSKYIYREYFKRIFFPLNISDIDKDNLSLVFEGITLFQKFQNINQDTLSKSVAKGAYENFKVNKIFDKFLKLDEKKLELHIVDLGCGKGTFLAEFLNLIINDFKSIKEKFVFHLILVDLDSSAIDERKAQYRIEESLERYNFVELKFNNIRINFMTEECYEILKNQNEIYDIIFINQVLDMYSKISLEINEKDNLNYFEEVNIIDRIFQRLSIKSLIREGGFYKDIKNHTDNVKLYEKIKESLNRTLIYRNSQEKLLTPFYYHILNGVDEIFESFKNFELISYNSKFQIQNECISSIVNFINLSKILNISDRIFNNDIFKQSPNYIMSKRVIEDNSILSKFEKKYEIKSTDANDSIPIFKIIYSIIQKKRI